MVEGIRQRQGRTGDRGPSRSGQSAALYWIWVVGILSHASWVMATNEGTSMIPIVSQGTERDGIAQQCGVGPIHRARWAIIMDMVALFESGAGHGF